MPWTGFLGPGFFGFRKGEEQNPPPPEAGALARSGCLGKEPPALFAGKLAPAMEDCFQVSFGTFFHEHPQEYRQFTPNNHEEQARSLGNQSWIELVAGVHLPLLQNFTRGEMELVHAQRPFPVCHLFIQELKSFQDSQRLQ